uniref:Beta-defensin-like domain-containing protein n=1 Tax=Sciurus vulgaris TaxID=55149 RepID=A0A8D2AVT4_SCIVU
GCHPFLHLVLLFLSESSRSGPGGSHISTRAFLLSDTDTPPSLPRWCHESKGFCMQLKCPITWEEIGRCDLLTQKCCRRRWERG